MNFRSDHISHNEINALLEKHSGKKVKMVQISEQEMHEGIANPKTIPKELAEGSAFRKFSGKVIETRQYANFYSTPDFWYLVKGTQGQGRFYRPRGQIHNDMFPEVQVTTFETYFKQKLA